MLRIVLPRATMTWNRLPDLMAEAFAAVVDVGKAIAAALSGRYAAHVRDLSSSGECPAGFARQTRPGIFFAGSRHRRRLNQSARQEPGPLPLGDRSTRW
jgi:hypothetical protein